MQNYSRKLNHIADKPTSIHAGFRINYPLNFQAEQVDRYSLVMMDKYLNGDYLNGKAHTEET